MKQSYQRNKNKKQFSLYNSSTKTSLVASSYSARVINKYNLQYKASYRNSLKNFRRLLSILSLIFGARPKTS